MLPTNIAKPKVLSIHASLSRDAKSKKVASKDAKNAKSFKIKRPKIIPLNKESSTLLVYKARNMAKRDGKIERIEVSMTKTHTLKVLNQLYQIFLYRGRTLFV
jgi:hypothetical protein